MYTVLVEDACVLMLALRSLGGCDGVLGQVVRACRSRPPAVIRVLRACAYGAVRGYIYIFFGGFFYRI